MATKPQIINRGNYKVIDPNPVFHAVDHEELFTYISLVAKTKGRTYLTEKEDGTLEIKPLNLQTTDMVVGRDKSFLTTEWTNIGGSQLIGSGEREVGVGDLEGFGITNIDIEIKSSFIPKVVIDFVDIRGATLFEQGSCSPYSVFFHMPYPIFELTVKGYYGKPVRYYLNLIKFNTKFNAETGNFESKGEFIGYSYAFLADMLMGFVMAAGKMYDWNSAQVLESKYEETIEYYKASGTPTNPDGLFDRNTFSDGNLQANPDNPFCPIGPDNLPDCMTIPDLLRRIKFIEAFLEKVKGTVEYDEVGNLVAVRGQIQAMISKVKAFSRDLVEHGAKRPVLTKNPNRKTRERFEWTEEPNSTIKKDFKFYFQRLSDTNASDDGVLVDDVSNIKGRVVRAKAGKGRESGCAGSIVDLATSSGKGCPPENEVDKLNVFDILNNDEWQKGFSEFNWKDGPAVDGKSWYVDLGYILNYLEEDIVKLDTELELRRDQLKDGINEGVKNELGFLPTVRNVFTVLACNTETFMELLLECNILAEKHHNDRAGDYESMKLNDSNRRIMGLKGKVKNFKVYPWPTYYEKDYPDITATDGRQSKPSTKEVYPGEKSEFQTWEEVRFVEDFLRAMLDLNRELDSLKEDKTGEPGYDNYTPITPLENKLLGNDIAIKYLDLADTGQGQVDENILRYIGERMFITTHHTLFDPVHLNNINSGIGIGPKHNTSWGGNKFWDKKFIGYSNDYNLIRKLARVDCDNMLNTIQNDTVLRRVDDVMDTTDILQSVVNSFKDYGTIEENVDISIANPAYDTLFDENKNLIKGLLEDTNYITYIPPNSAGAVGDGIALWAANSIARRDLAAIHADHNVMQNDNDGPLLFQMKSFGVSSPNIIKSINNDQPVTYNSANSGRSEDAAEALKDALNHIRAKNTTFAVGVLGQQGVNKGWDNDYESTKGVFFQMDTLFSSLGPMFDIKANGYDNAYGTTNTTNAPHSNMGVIGFLTGDDTNYVGTQMKMYDVDAFGADTGDLLWGCQGGYFMWRHYDENMEIMPPLELPSSGILAGAEVSGNRDWGLSNLLGDGPVRFNDVALDSTAKASLNLSINNSVDKLDAYAQLVVFDTLIQTPLWSDNVNRYREVAGSLNIDGRSFVNGEDAKLKSPPADSNIIGYTSEDIEKRNLAYLFLSGCKPSPLITLGPELRNSGDASHGVADAMRGVYPKALSPFVQIGGLIKAPRVWVLGLGATLWRWKMFMGKNTDGDGTILWRHPLWGETPTGMDPLSQPGHPGPGGYTSIRFNRSRTATSTTKGGLYQDSSDEAGDNIIWRSFIGKGLPNMTPTMTSDGLTTQSAIQKSSFSPNTITFKQTGNAVLGNDNKPVLNATLGYYFDYWGVYNNNDTLRKKRPQSFNFYEYANLHPETNYTGAGNLRWDINPGDLVWSTFNAKIPQQLGAARNDLSEGTTIFDMWTRQTSSWWDGDVLRQGLAYYKPNYGGTNRQASGVENSNNKKTFWPNLWVAPWQHFYTEPITILGKAEANGTASNKVTSNLIEKSLIFLPSDKAARDYRGSFMGVNWDNTNYKDTDPTETIETIKITDFKGQERDYSFVYQGAGSSSSSQSIEGRYGDLIALLPDFIKDEFVEVFEEWAENEWSDKWLEVVDPVNFHPEKKGEDLLRTSYTVKSFNGDTGSYVRPGSELYGIASADRFEDYYISEASVTGSGFRDYMGWTVFNNEEGRGTDLFKHLFDDYYTILSSTPKIWNSVYQKFPHFTANKKVAEIYTTEFQEYFKKNYAEKQRELDDNNQDEEDALSGSVIEDRDTKLALYRSFKSLSDKWISSSSKSGLNSRMFFNIVDSEYNTSGNVPLAGHFSYVNRVMGEIGNKSVIDVTKMDKIQDNPKMSLYQTVTELLSENKFDFFPLPSFTNFTSGNDEELEQMFTPIDTLNGVNSGPNFICMFVGGTSRTLDIKPKANCYMDQEDINYENDSFNLSEDGADLPNEITDPLDDDYGKDRLEGKGFTAFRVAYGLENQNHFKNITLDQTEFSETNESLLLIDRLAKGGDPANRTAKGNNLHNVYLTRSYTCGVESLGNMMIQPLQYFELTNVPMFHGTYIITEVKHNIKPHHVGTSFKGTRQPMATVPIVTDTATAMKITIKDLEANGSGTFLEDVIGGGDGSSGSSGSSGGGSTTPTSTSNVQTIGDLSKGCKNGKNPMSALIHKAGGVNGKPEAGTNIEMITVPNPLGPAKHVQVSEPQFLKEGVEPMKQMLTDLDSYLKGLGYSKTVQINSLFRSKKKQDYLCCGGPNCYKSGRCPQTGSPYGNKRDGSVAVPGTSKHGEGIAVDFGFFKKDGSYISSSTKNNSVGFNTDQYTWLFERSYLYGFIPRDTLRDGRTDEFWHWEYVGKAAFSYMAAFPEGKNKHFDKTWEAINGEPQYYSFVKNPIDSSTGVEADLTCVETSTPINTGGEEGGSVDPSDPNYGTATLSNVSRDGLSYTNKLTYIGKI